MAGESKKEIQKRLTICNAYDDSPWSPVGAMTNLRPRIVTDAHPLYVRQGLSPAHAITGGVVAESTKHRERHTREQQRSRAQCIERECELEGVRVEERESARANNCSLPYQQREWMLGVTSHRD
jgi:hypothetical protein